MCRAFKRAATATLPRPDGATGADIAVRVGSMLGRGWSVASGAGFTTSVAPGVALGASIAAPIFAGFAACYGIGRISEQANALGRYNAFLAAFAHSVSDFARGTDRRRYNAVWLDAAIQGRNAAIRVLTEIGAEERRRVLRGYGRMSDQQAVDAVIATMGGYRTR